MKDSHDRKTAYLITPRPGSPSPCIHPKKHARKPHAKKQQPDNAPNGSAKKNMNSTSPACYYLKNS